MPVANHSAIITPIINITDNKSMGQAKRHAKIVLPCHVDSYTSTPSHTAVISVLRLLSIAYSSRAQESSSQRMQIIEEIHEELGDLGY
ncbi:MAG: hypothetical protein AB8B79_12050 [Granulosicoccus sp.]